MKKLVIEITTEDASGSYDLTVAAGTPQEGLFVNEPLAGVKGRLASIVDNLGDYLTEVPKSEAAKKDEPPKPVPQAGVPPSSNKA